MAKRYETDRRTGKVIVSASEIGRIRQDIIDNGWKQENQIAKRVITKGNRTIAIEKYESEGIDAVNAYIRQINKRAWDNMKCLAYKNENIEEWLKDIIKPEDIEKIDVENIENVEEHNTGDEENVR